MFGVVSMVPLACERKIVLSQRVLCQVLPACLDSKQSECVVKLLHHITFVLLETIIHSHLRIASTQRMDRSNQVLAANAKTDGTEALHGRIRRENCTLPYSHPPEASINSALKGQIVCAEAVRVDLLAWPPGLPWSPRVDLDLGRLVEPLLLGGYLAARALKASELHSSDDSACSGRTYGSPYPTHQHRRLSIDGASAFGCAVCQAAVGVSSEVDPSEGCALHARTAHGIER